MSRWFDSPSFEDQLPSWLSDVILANLNVNKYSAAGKAIISLFNIGFLKDLIQDK